MKKTNEFDVKVEALILMRTFILVFLLGGVLVFCSWMFIMTPDISYDCSFKVSGDISFYEEHGVAVVNDGKGGRYTIPKDSNIFLDESTINSVMATCSGSVRGWIYG